MVRGKGVAAVRDVYTVTVGKDGDRWTGVASGPRLEPTGHAASETRSISALEEDVRDTIAVLTDRDLHMPHAEAVSDFDICWDYSGLPESTAAALADYFAVRAERSHLEDRYAASVRRAAAELTGVAHASYRDAARVLGLSHQRVSQVLRGQPPELDGKLDEGE